MATGLVIHISSGDDRHTEILTDDQIRIGACDNCELRLRSSSLPKTLTNSVLLELTRANGSYRVMSFAPVAVTLNGEPIEEGVEIHDGDEVRVADGDLLLPDATQLWPGQTQSGQPDDAVLRRLLELEVGQPIGQATERIAEVLAAIAGGAR